MIDVLITLVPSICWLLYRCYKVLNTPAHLLATQLHLDIPHMATLCLDSLSGTSAFLHWDVEMKEDELLTYTLEINDMLVPVKTSTSCKLTNLSRSKVYKISLIVLNSLNKFRSKSLPVYIELPCDETKIIDTDEEACISARKVTEESDMCQDLSVEVSIDNIHSIDDFDVLNDQLRKSQNDLQKVTREYKSFEDHSHEELRSLQEELTTLKKGFEKGSESKTKKDHNLKDLEKQKETIAYQKLKLNGQLKALENTSDLWKAKLSEYNVKIDKERTRNQHLLGNEENEKISIHEEVSALMKSIESIKAENLELEQSLRDLSLEKRSLNTIMDSARPLLEAFDKEIIFNRDGTLTSSAFTLLQAILEVFPSWRRDIIETLLANEERGPKSDQNFVDKGDNIVDDSVALQSYGFSGMSEIGPKLRIYESPESMGSRILTDEGHEEHLSSTFDNQGYAPIDDYGLMRGTDSNLGFNYDANNNTAGNVPFLQRIPSPVSPVHDPSSLTPHAMPLFNNRAFNSPSSEQVGFTNQMNLFNEISNLLSPLPSTSSLWNTSNIGVNSTSPGSNYAHDINGATSASPLASANIQNPMQNDLVNTSISNLLLNSQPITGPYLRNNLWSDNNHYGRWSSSNSSQIWRNDAPTGSTNWNNDLQPYFKNRDEQSRYN